MTRDSCRVYEKAVYVKRKEATDTKPAELKRCERVEGKSVFFRTTTTKRGTAVAPLLTHTGLHILYRGPRPE